MENRIIHYRKAVYEQYNFLDCKSKYNQFKFQSSLSQIFQMVTQKKYEKKTNSQSESSALRHLDHSVTTLKSKGKEKHICQVDQQKSQSELPIQSSLPLSQPSTDTDFLSYGLNFPFQNNIFTLSQQPYFVNTDNAPSTTYMESAPVIKMSGIESRTGTLMSQSSAGQPFLDGSHSAYRDSFPEDFSVDHSIPQSSSSDDFPVGNNYNQSSFPFQGERAHFNKIHRQQSVLSTNLSSTTTSDIANRFKYISTASNVPASDMHTKIRPVPILQPNSFPVLRTNGKPRKEKLVKIALRKRCYKRKKRRISGNGTSLDRANLAVNTNHQERKSRIGRPLNPKTKIKLTLVPNLVSLHSLLVSTHKEQDITILTQGNFTKKMVAEELDMDPNIEWKFRPNQHGEVFPGQAHTLIFVDKGYQLTKDESRAYVSPYLYPGAIGFEYIGKHTDLPTNPGNEDKDRGTYLTSGQGVIPIYDDFALAVRELFQARTFSLVRVTRAAAFERTGAIVLKLETAHPGDIQLNDEDEIVDNGRNNEDGKIYLGQKGDPITTAFIKKRIARPRYKADMRIYFIPRDTNAVLYSREAMLERDLLNGIVNPLTEKRLVTCAFDSRPLLRKLGITQRQSIQ